MKMSSNWYLIKKKKKSDFTNIPTFLIATTKNEQQFIKKTVKFIEYCNNIIIIYNQCFF